MKQFDQLPKNEMLKEITVCSLFVVIFVIINTLIAAGVIPIKWICNYGIAFGVEIPQLLFIAAWCITMVVLVYLWSLAHKSGGSLVYRYGLLFVITGAFANILDRVIHGCVVDYIALVPWNHFNLADATIFIGVVFIIFDAFSTKKE